MHVTVCICTRNRGDSIIGTLRGIVALDYDDFDVVIVDQSSGDDTAHAVEQAIGGDDRFEYVRSCTVGASAARNAGIAQARGNMIAFLDDDDVWTPDGLVQLVAALRAHRAYGAVVGRFTLADANLHADAGPYPERALRSDRMFDQLLGFIPHLSTVLVRTDVARAVGPLDKALYGGEDWDWMLRIAHRYPVGFVDAVISNLRRHADIRDYTASTEEGVALRRFRDVMIVFRTHTRGLRGWRWLRAQRAGLAYRGTFAHDFLAYSRHYRARGDRRSAAKCGRMALQASPLHVAWISARRLRERMS